MMKINFDDTYTNLQNKQCKEEISKYVQNLTIMFMELVMRKKKLGSKYKYLYDSKEYFSFNDIENKTEDKKKDIFKINQNVRDIIIYVISKIIEEFTIINKNTNNKKLLISDFISCSIGGILYNIKEMVCINNIII